MLGKLSKYVRSRPNSRDAGQYMAVSTVPVVVKLSNDTSVVQVREKCTYHGENHPILVYKLVAVEREKSDVLDSTLSGGLRGIITASECGGSRDWCNRHSATEEGPGRDTSSGGVLFGNVSTALVPDALGMTSSRVGIPTPSISVFADECPSSRLSEAIPDGVRRLSIVISEGNEEKDDEVDAGMLSTGPRRCWVVEPVAGTSVDCAISGLEINEPQVYEDLVSITWVEGTGGGREGRSSNKVCTF